MGTAPAEIERFAFSVPETATALNLSPREVWNQVKSGSLASRKCGRRVIIPREAISAYIQSLPSAANDRGR
jgi:Helix-turn-helix domain